MKSDDSFQLAVCYFFYEMANVKSAKSGQSTDELNSSN